MGTYKKVSEENEHGSIIPSKFVVLVFILIIIQIMTIYAGYRYFTKLDSEIKDLKEGNAIKPDSENHERSKRQTAENPGKIDKSSEVCKIIEQNCPAKSTKGQKGEPGIFGPPGIVGVPGLMGPQGFPGRPGIDGLAGEKGQKGEQGLSGIPGRPGREGLPGPQGITGSKGEPGLSKPLVYEGPKGDKGDKGEQGISGL